MSYPLPAFISVDQMLDAQELQGVKFNLVGQNPQAADDTAQNAFQDVVGIHEDTAMVRAIGAIKPLAKDAEYTQPDAASQYGLVPDYTQDIGAVATTTGHLTAGSPDEFLKNPNLETGQILYYSLTAIKKEQQELAGDNNSLTASMLKRQKRNEDQVNAELDVLKVKYADSFSGYHTVNGKRVGIVIDATSEVESKTELLQQAQNDKDNMEKMLADLNAKPFGEIQNNIEGHQASIDKVEARIEELGGIIAKTTAALENAQAYAGEMVIYAPELAEFGDQITNNTTQIARLGWQETYLTDLDGDDTGWFAVNRDLGVGKNDVVYGYIDPEIDGVFKESSNK